MNEITIPDEIVMNKIFLIRGTKVMLDKDLAELYGVSTGNLNKTVNRNMKRFPDDFMFRLTKPEFDNMIFQTGTSSWGGTRKLPNAFTEQGVAMLSSVLNSERAIMVNIQIIRVFNRVRSLLETHAEILHKLELIERNDLEQNKSLFKNIR
jgi:hypothetical protein